MGGGLRRGAPRHRHRLTASDITFHRCFWAGLVLLPLAWRDGLADLNGIGWGRGLVLTFLGGPGIAFVSYSGFHLVPLGHGGVIQPSSAALFGLLLATVVLLERLPPRRAIGARRDRRGAVRDRRRGDRDHRRARAAGRRHVRAGGPDVRELRHAAAALARAADARHRRGQRRVDGGAAGLLGRCSASNG